MATLVNKTLIRAKTIHGQERFALIDTHIFDAALGEKKQCQTLRCYASIYGSGGLTQFRSMFNEVQKQIGEPIDICLERITLKDGTS